MKKNCLRILLLIFVTTLAVISCQKKDPGAITLKLGHEGPITDPRQVAAETFKRIVETETNKQVTVEIYPASSLGDWRELQEGLQIGSVDIVIEDIGTLQRFNDIAAIGWAAFLYKDREHYMKVWAGEIGQQIRSDLEKATGFRLLGLMYRGARNLNSIKKIDNLDELRGIKIRVPNSVIAIDTWKALGANPQAMSYTEVFGALQQGVIDAQENPLESIFSDSVYEVAPYINLTEHVLGAYNFQFWGKTFDSWPENVQAAIKNAVDAASTEFTDGLTSREANIIDQLKNNPKVYIVPVSAEIRSQMAELSINMLNEKYQILAPYIKKIQEAIN